MCGGLSCGGSPGQEQNLLLQNAHHKLFNQNSQSQTLFSKVKVLE